MPSCYPVGCAVRLSTPGEGGFSPAATHEEAFSAREAYESLVIQTLEMLKERLPLDGLFFDIHGAMSVQELDDPDLSARFIPLSNEIKR